MASQVSVYSEVLPKVQESVLEQTKKKTTSHGKTGADRYACRFCGHSWTARNVRGELRKPKRCKRCHNQHWDVEAPKKIAVCAQYRSSFEMKTNWQVYCSRVCCQRASEDLRKPFRRRVGSEPEWESEDQVKSCNHCGKPFTMLTAFQKYCSDACRYSSRKIDHSPIPCKVCGKMFIPALLHQATCSLKCWCVNYSRRRVNHSRLTSLRVKYGMTMQDYQDLVKKQDGRCAICGNLPQGRCKGDRELHVDHDHQSNKIRGLLCMDCNLALGGFHDNAQSLRQAVGYLEFYRVQEAS